LASFRALYAGQPFGLLKPEHYEQWKEKEITFDPRSMIRGSIHDPRILSAAAVQEDNQ
jgi:hypothetical protein